MVDCKWLPGFYEYPDWNNYKDYEEKLYSFFTDKYLSKLLIFKDKELRLRHSPKENNKIEAFFHLTCKNYTDKKNRSPSPERIIRIEWPLALMQNYICCEDCCDEKPLYWVKLDSKGRIKHYIYFRSYLVIIEERKLYYLLITGFYVEEDYYHMDLIEDYENYQKAENAT